MASGRILRTQKKRKPSSSRINKPKSPNALVNINYKKIYDESPTLQRTINKRGIIIACNNAYADGLGYSKKEIIGKSIFLHVAKGNNSAMRKSFETWKRNGVVENQEVWFKRKDGTTFPTLISATSIYDMQGKMIGSNTSIKDISDIYNARVKLEKSGFQLKKQFDELKKANNLLALAEEKYRTLYEKTPVLKRTIDFEGRLTDCNELYTKALGYTKEEAMRSTIYDHTAERSLDDMRNEFEHWKKTYEVSRREIWLKRKDGSVFPTLLSGASLTDEHGKVIGRTVALMDLTEIHGARKKIEESEQQIRKQYEQLQKLDSLKNDFLTMITHELKTPLVPIKGYIDILISETLGSLNPEQQKRLEIIKSSTNSLLKLVSDLLDAQKLEMGLLKMNKDIHDLSEIIRNTANRMRPNTEKKGIVISTKIEESIPFFCDNTRVEQVISNLITNSLDFCPSQGGKIDIELKDRDDGIKIVVKDNGIGIVKENLDKIFVKFYQIDTSATREHGGTGIGLSVCKGIVEGHGGKIWAESEGRNKGTEIHILLPKVG
jgi:PAS domain S-box-containing protein